MKSYSAKVALLLTAFILSAACLGDFAHSAPITSSNPWAPTQQDDFFAVSIDLISPSSNYLYIYDWGNPSGNKLKVLDDLPYSGEMIYFTKDNANNWWAGYEKGALTLSLGDSYLFGFGFSNGTDFYTSYSLTRPSLYQLSNSETGMNILTNASPVPIPAAALMLGTGLIGLVVIRKRRG